MDDNVVYVSRNLNDGAMWRTSLTLNDVHWINKPARDGESVHVRMRHRAKLLPATLLANELTLTEPDRAITAGQSAVIYRDSIVLGGGIVA